MILFLLLRNISPLSIKKLDVEVTNTFRFELPPNGIIELGSLIRKYRLPNKKHYDFTELPSYNGNSCGYFWSTIEQLGNKKVECRNIFIKEEFFTNENKDLTSLLIIRTLYPKCKLVYRIPDLTLNDRQRAGCSLKIGAKNIHVFDFFDNNFVEFIRSYENKRQILLESCLKIEKDLDLRVRYGIYGLLQSKKYILLFFKEDYSKIQAFFKNFYEAIKDLEILPLNAIYKLFEDAVEDYLEGIVDVDWLEYFTRNMYDYDKKKKVLLWFLLTDIMNLINLSVNPRYIFNLVSTSEVSEEIVGRSVLLINFDLLKIPFFDLENVVFKDQRDNILTCKRISKSEGILYFWYDTHELMRKEVKFITVSILTPNGKYESGRLDITKFY